MLHKPYEEKQAGSIGSIPVKVPVKTADGQEAAFENINPYFPDIDLVRAVNVALLLDRPLLVMGEPGCGKSLLAKDIAYHWYKDKMYTDDKYFKWNIKSTSKAKEGLYEYDYLGRLRDAQAKLPQANDAGNYVRFGQLAKAMKASAADAKAVLLIDEIDKADIDFSNDLLNELEENSFTVTETTKTVSYPHKPLVVITSNSEKDLSDAFLRRCVFHYIDLFSNDKIASEDPKIWLRRIVQARYYGQDEEVQPEVNQAIDAFIDLRKLMNNDLTYRKTVSTSEFLDWFAVIKKCKDQPALAEKMSLSRELSAWINKTDKKIPFGNSLFKTTKALLNLKTSGK